MIDNMIKEMLYENFNNAYAPLSNFKVSCVLQMDSGKLYTGVNVEHKSGLSLGMCAERNAFISAISNNEFDFSTIYLIGGTSLDNLTNIVPCGICRQYMASYNINLKVVCFNGISQKEYILSDLIPNLFSEEF